MTINTIPLADAPKDYGWTSDQAAAVDKIIEWWADVENEITVEGVDAPVFRLHGLAGSGKTYLIRNLPEILGVKVKFVAPSGKAARVLRQKGKCHNASTIHSFIYWAEEKHRRYDFGPREGEIMLDDEGLPITDTEWILKTSAAVASINETRREKGENAIDGPGDYDLIVVDECSMVGSKIAGDLQKFGVPILACGDPFQLPPPSTIKDPVSGRNVPDVAPWAVEDTHDALLTQITRQAEGNPIIRLAHAIRNGDPVFMDRRLDDVSPPRVAVRSCPTPIVDMHVDWASRAHQLLVEKNDQKISWNERLRRMFFANGRLKAPPESEPGVYYPVPVAGDRLVRLRNRNRSTGKEVQIYLDEPTSVEVAGQTIEIKTGPIITNQERAMNGETYRVLWAQNDADVWDRQSKNYQMRLLLLQEDNEYAKPFFEVISGNLFEWEWHTHKDHVHKNSRTRWGFGWAITVHKSQGSQWANVAVYCRQMMLGRKKEHRRWLYTAVTRAAERAMILIEPAG